MNPYDLTAWHELFVMVGGAAAAIAGLIFVAVSLNHEHVLSAPVLPSLAAQTLGLLIGLVLMSVIVLTPDLQHVGGGLAITALGWLTSAFVIVANLRIDEHDARRWWTVSRLLLGCLATVPAVAAGLSLLVKTGGGLYWLTLDVVLAFTVSVYYAWILLIEVRR